MDNYEAFLQMDRDRLEYVLDQVYLTGLNNGLYAARLPNDSEEQLQVLDENPFDARWLSAPAEKALLGPPDEDGDEHVLDEMAAAVLRLAGIPYPDPES